MHRSDAPPTIWNVKKCSKCGEQKPLTDYYEQATCKGGRRPDCKTCVCQREHEKRVADPEKFKAYEKARYARDKEKRKTKAREYYAANREAGKAVRRKHYAANRDTYLAYSAKRKAAKRAVEHVPYTRTEIYERDGGHCRECHLELHNVPNGFDIDHIVPLSLGGVDTPANLQLMCRPCNRAKWANLEGQIHLPV